MDALWLQKQFENQPTKSKSDLAKILGLEPSAISKILGGKRQIKAHEYVLMCNFFGLSHDVPFSVERTGMQEKNDARINENWTIPEIKEKSHGAEKLKVFKLKENTMAPEFRLGDYVAVDTKDRVPSPAGVFMISDGFGTLIRNCTLQPLSMGEEIVLSANDPNFETQILQVSEFEIIGRVVGKVALL